MYIYIYTKTKNIYVYIYIYKHLSAFSGIFFFGVGVGVYHWPPFSVLKAIKDSSEPKLDPRQQGYKTEELAYTLATYRLSYFALDANGDLTIAVIINQTATLRIKWASITRVRTAALVLLLEFACRAGCRRATSWSTSWTASRPAGWVAGWTTSRSTSWAAGWTTSRSTSRLLRRAV